MSASRTTAILRFAVVLISGSIIAILLGFLASRANPDLSWTVSANIGALAIVVGALVRRRENILESPLGPMMIVVATSGFAPAVLGYFTAVPLYGISSEDYAVASTIWLLFVVVATVTYAILTPTSRIPSLAGAGASRGYSELYPRLLLSWFVSLGIALVVAVILVRGAGGFGAYIDSLNERGAIFAGKVYLKALLTGPAIASLAILAVYRKSSSHHRGILIAALVLMSASLLLLTGSRQQPVVFLAAVAVVYHYAVRPLAYQQIIVGIVVIVLFGLGFAGATRGVKQDQTLVVTPTDAWARLEVAGPITDFGQMASIALIARDESTGHTFGRTYAAAATIFLPSSIAPWKLPAAGAVASDRYLPTLFAKGTALQTSFPGEGFLNFGWLGVVTAGVLFGWIMRVVRGMARPQNLAALLLFSLILPRIALLFREDLANVTGFLVIDLLVLFIVLAASGALGPGFRSQPRSG